MFSIWDVVMEQRPFLKQNSGRTYSALISLVTWWKPETKGALAETSDFLNCHFHEGDASSALDKLSDKSFDLVVSIFGAMFAPKPFEVAKEMVRVTKPGGKIVMGNWIPGDPTLVAQILKISSAYTPPPPEGFVSPMLWGLENNVVERFVHAGVKKENISVEKDTFVFNASYSPGGTGEHIQKLLRTHHECI